MLIRWFLNTTQSRKTIQVMKKSKTLFCPNDYWEREGYWRLNQSSRSNHMQYNENSIKTAKRASGLVNTWRLGRSLRSPRESMKAPCPIAILHLSFYLSVCSWVTHKFRRSEGTTKLPHAIVLGPKSHENRTYFVRALPYMSFYVAVGLYSLVFLY